MDLYILNHLGEDRETIGRRRRFSSRRFSLPTVAAFRDSFRDEFTRTTYTRGNNPTVEILRKKDAALEGAEECLMFASGAGAFPLPSWRASAPAIMSSACSGRIRGRVACSMRSGASVSRTRSSTAPMLPTSRMR
jgi:hypothetical protein